MPSLVYDTNRTQPPTVAPATSCVLKMPPSQLPDPPAPLWDLYIPMLARCEDGSSQDPHILSVEMSAYSLCQFKHRDEMASVTLTDFYIALDAMDSGTYMAFIKGWGTHAIAYYHQTELLKFLLREDRRKREFFQSSPTVTCIN
jgi:hypothetical protein